jgi:hypothetical protein
MMPPEEDGRITRIAYFRSTLLSYFAKPAGLANVRAEFADEKVGWYGPEDRDAMHVNVEAKGWCERALAALGAA